MNSYYDLLGVSVDASSNTIHRAYNDRIASLYQELVNNQISADDYNRLYTACTEAKDILINPETRQAYNERLGLGENLSDNFTNLAGQTGAHVTEPQPENNQPENDEPGDDLDDDDIYDDDEELENNNNSGKKRKWIKIAIATGAIVAVIATAAWLGPKLSKSHTPNDDKQSTVTVEDGKNQGGAIVGIGNGEDSKTDGAVIAPSGDKGNGKDTTSTPEQKPTVTIKNYGDIKDVTLVNERATILLDEMNAAGMTNLTTSLPYTLEEIQTLILYVNGEYTPENEEEASRLYTEYLNFICAQLNVEDTLIQSAYLGGEDSFKETMEGYAKNPKKPDIVTAFTYGDSFVAPYLNWLQTKYYELRYTTDRDKATKLFNEIFQSYADIMKGDGFTLDGVTYTEKNILGLDKVAVSNLYIYFGLNAEVFRTTKTQDYFTVTNHLISANPDEQKDTVSYDEVAAWLNGACDISLIPVDDQGRPLVTSGEEGKSLGELTQINTIYRAKDNFINKTQTLSK